LKGRKIVVYIAVAGKEVGWRRRVGVAGGGVRKRENGGGRKLKGGRKREPEGERFNFFFLYFCFFVCLSCHYFIGRCEV